MKIDIPTNANIRAIIKKMIRDEVNALKVENIGLRKEIRMLKESLKILERYLKWEL